jgi:hypothetical protein
MPSSLSPGTTSLLLSELARPLSPQDREPGYIYVFHLTPSVPAAAPPTEPGPGSKILLKIGRASNVQRRLNEWSRQCGHTPSLLRYYPHVPTPAQGSRAAAVPRRVPNIHRVERLIHVELGEKRVSRACDGCEKVHREWFEVDGTREALKSVDEVVRRWVDWGERQTQPRF